MATVDKVERLLNLISTLLSTTRPLTAEELRDAGPGLPRRQAELPAGLRARQGRPARDGHPARARADRGRRPARRGLPHRPRAATTSPIPGFEPDELAALHLARQRRAPRRARRRRRTLEAGRGGGRAATGRGGPSRRRRGAWPPCPPTPTWPPCSRPAPNGARSPSPTTTRTALIDPHRVDFQRGHWYLTGFDHQRQDERNFRLDRIDGAVDARRRPAAFERRGRQPARACPPIRGALGEGPEVIARLLVDADQVAWATSQLGDATVAERRPRRLRRVRGGGDQLAGVPLVRARLPRPRRGARRRRSSARTMMAWLADAGRGERP